MSGPAVFRLNRIVVGLLVAAYLAFGVFVYANPGSRGEGGTAPEAACRGKRVWLRHNCTACHQIFGLGGYLGPDLTNAVSRRGDGFVQAIVSHGSGDMPRLDLTAAEVEDLVAYLRYVDGQGRFPLRGWPPRGFNN